ncbi:Sen15 protein-domain-containing protein [Halteromyces radiatus]|uniref:Sen15 protein-domain-containing protein n=1 Tax=Halteromyces radiatus TaxID=101107 RepID=UPI00222110CD|nr:Sen15 protein-domain-containing protein [Halteromyces radiatus]KAI8099671.1 Sen15 protein-domain-containing protein [Halteromyces radiatus]
MEGSFKAQYDQVETLASAFPDNSTLIEQTYKDLVLNKLWKTVNVVPVESLNTCILHAHEPGTPISDRLVIVPLRYDQVLSMDKINETFRMLDKEQISNELESLTCLKKITFAIVASDATMLYYHIARGLVPPKEH